MSIMEKMRFKFLIFSLISLLLAVVLASPVVAASPVHKVTGGGTADWPGGRATYGFNVIQTDEFGDAKGKVHVQVRDESDVTGLLEIDALYLAVNSETGDAWIGGVVTKANPSIYEGIEIIWRVQDNGSGKSASGPDMTSTIIRSLAIRALEMPLIPLRQVWTNGNITVN